VPSKTPQVPNLRGSIVRIWEWRSRFYLFSSWKIDKFHCKSSTRNWITDNAVYLSC
jgi:hypothetical protein